MVVGGEGGHKHFCHISGVGGSRIFFQRDGGGVVKCFAHHMKM